MKIELNKEDFIQISKALFIAQNLLRAADPFSDFKKEIKSFSNFYKLAANYGLENDGDLADIEECPSFLMDLGDARTLRNFTEECCTKISWKVLADEFAKRELGKILDMLNGDEFEIKQIRHNTLKNKMKKYIQEFSNNGFQNLKFKLLRSPKEDSDQ